MTAAMAQATAAVPPTAAAAGQAQSRARPADLGVIQTQPMALIPGSSEPMKPVRVKTVQVKAGHSKLASAGPSQPRRPITNTIPPARADVPETSDAVMARLGRQDRAEPDRRARSERQPRARAAAAAGRPRHRQRHSRRAAGFQRRCPGSVQLRPPQRRMAYGRSGPGPRSCTAARPCRRRAIRAEPLRFTAAGSFRSARSRARDEAQQRIDAARNRPAACSARPIRSPSRSSPRTTEAVPRPLCRPRARSGRSGVPGAEALRHFLHDRPQLTAELSSDTRIKSPRFSDSAAFLLFGDDLPPPTPRRCKPLVKNLRLKVLTGKDRPRRTTAGGSGRLAEFKQKQLAVSSVWWRCRS